MAGFAPLNDKALDTLFREARTLKHWRDKPVSDETLHQLYDLMKFGPTSANCCPARIVFVRSPEAKARLKAHVDEGNLESVGNSPVTAIIAYDLKFYDKMPKLFPHAPGAREWFTGDLGKAKDTAFRNGSLQGAYLMLAARSLGLDCGPMSGFNSDAVKKEFFLNQDIEPNFICNLGYGDWGHLYPRGPRLDFDEACKIL